MTTYTEEAYPFKDDCNNPYHNHMTTQSQADERYDVIRAVTDICFDNGGVTKPMADKLADYVLDYAQKAREEAEIDARIDEIKHYCWPSIIQTARQLGMAEPLTWEAAHLLGLTPMMADGRIADLELKKAKKEKSDE